ncbi:EAL domain-containing protein [Planosporangium flavigriseum]|uniref:EAL domain-containing protein n=1 Tax=Planosporangium flavigriseum TaxID=373681 RepID=UPI0023B32095|nr:EAL domain-containing protein [Planosporangium flavigriseum]
MTTSGYASLALITELPIDELKVDRSFIVRMDESPAHVVIVTAVATNARSLDRTVVGEGIEDAATAERLRDLGLHLLQGYHFGRPVPPEQLALPTAAPTGTVR